MKEEKQLKHFALALAVVLMAGCRGQLPAPTDNGEQPEPTPGVSVLESLPLQRGYFVEQGTPCGSASNASVTLHTGHGINAAQANCELTGIEKTGDNRYAARETCYFIRGGEQSRQVNYTINDRTSYSENDPQSEREYSARHCPQVSLPEPWRSNDLSDLLK